MTETQYITTEEACGILDLSESELDSVVSDGLLVRVRVGKRKRYRREDVEYIAGEFPSDNGDEEE